jgi:hypothetical protein
MKNNDEFRFKVMPWLRKIREENAKETEGMTVEERLAHTKKRAEWFYASNIDNPQLALNDKKTAYHAVETVK